MSPDDAAHYEHFRRAAFGLAHATNAYAEQHDWFAEATHLAQVLDVYRDAVAEWVRADSPTPDGDR